jgi:hypothetical protein
VQRGLAIFIDTVDVRPEVRVVEKESAQRIDVPSISRGM